MLPFLLVMLVGIIEFGRAWNEHQVITDAAREAARKGAISDGTVTRAIVVQTAIDAMERAGINTSEAEVEPVNWSGAPNTPITVSIDLPYRFTFFGPLVKWSTGRSNIMLKTAFSMRNE